jgi:hypothetical protein
MLPSGWKTPARWITPSPPDTGGRLYVHPHSFAGAKLISHPMRVTLDGKWTEKLVKLPGSGMGY